jgi:glutamine amidotransferase
MSDVVIVDVQGNLRSVFRAVEAAGQEQGVRIERSHDPDVVRRAARLIVPGQGDFGAWSRKLAGGLGEALLERLRAGTPYLGLCVGMQILFEGSDEAPGEPGLGWFRGTVQKLVGGGGVKIPHMGWNQVEARAGGHPYFEPNEWYYFVHSFHAVATEPGVVRGVSSYGVNTVTAVVSRDHVTATQFHPEKSQQAGLSLLARFLRG